MLHRLSALLIVATVLTGCKSDPVVPPEPDTAVAPQDTIVSVDTQTTEDTAQPGDTAVAVDTKQETVTGLNPHASCDTTPLVWAIPATETGLISNGFDRMTTVVAPNGKAIKIIAQKKVSDEMVIRARQILAFFLTDVPGSEYGADKTAVANKMAENGAMLMLPNGVHEEGNEPNINAQPLYAAENAIEGSKWYIENDWEHRDAAFEEIFHLVHDAGIGTYMPGALPAYQAELLAEAKAAIKDGRWGIAVDPGVSSWLQELAQENSLAQEYIASVIDSYYGFWGAFTERAGGMWGIYIAKTREEIATKDPTGMKLLEKFLPPFITYEARIDASFEGTFSMTFDPAKPYTHKSRYLLHARLMGTKDSGLMGNDQDNTLRGNAGDNVLDGAGGSDTAIYCGNAVDYTVTPSGDGVQVAGPDGTDTLRNIAFIRFGDAKITVSAR